MKKQWIVGTALLMLMTGNVWADGEPPTENILKDQFKKQYHGILKLDAITLKNLDAKGNQATWSAEGDVSSSDDQMCIRDRHNCQNQRLINAIFP